MSRLPNEDIECLLEDLTPNGRGYLAMLKTYLDLGAKKDSSDGVMCVASVIFKPTPYKQFVRAWNPMVNAWGAKALHATDFYNGGEEFKRDTAAKKELFEQQCRIIPNLIGHKARRILLVSFRPDEYLRVAPQQWKDFFGTSVHSIAVQLALISNGYWRQSRGPLERFAYFMESGDPGDAEIARTVAKMRNDTITGTSQHIRVGSFTTIEKGRARGLEAADFSAWHWNKHYMDKLRKGQEMNPRKDFEALVNSANGKLTSLFATGEKLALLFSLSRERLEKLTR